MPKGHFERTPEHRANIAKAMKGRVVTAEWREKISQAKKGHKWTEESRRKASEAKKGKPSGRVWNEQLAANMSAARKGKSGKLKRYGISNEEYEKQLSAGNRWCVFRKHFVSGADRFVSKTNVCSGCRQEYLRHGNLRNIFGVDPGWYAAKLKEQNGACAICKLKDCLSAGKKHFAIDHCHTTGRIRGLLCSRCNTALERLDMIPDWSANAVAYIDQYANIPDADVPVYRKKGRQYKRKAIPGLGESVGSEPESLVIRL